MTVICRHELPPSVLATFRHATSHASLSFFALTTILHAVECQTHLQIHSGSGFFRKTGRKSGVDCLILGILVLIVKCFQRLERPHDLSDCFAGNTDSVRIYRDNPDSHQRSVIRVVRLIDSDRVDTMSP